MEPAIAQGAGRSQPIVEGEQYATRKGKGTELQVRGGLW